MLQILARINNGNLFLMMSIIINDDDYDENDEEDDDDDDDDDHDQLNFEKASQSNLISFSAFLILASSSSPSRCSSSFS